MNKPIRALLVEDDHQYAEMMREMLRVHGAPFNLEHVSLLSDGLERLTNGNIDVVLLDLMLPDSKGFDTFAKAYGLAPQVPMVVLSGLDDEAVATRAVREGAQDYLVKGKVDGNSLIQAIRYAIERKQTEETLRQRNRELALLNRSSRAFSSILDLDQVLVTVLEEVRHLLNAVACSVWLTNSETGELVCQQATGPQNEIVRGWRLAPGEGLAGWVAGTGESLIVSDAQTDGRHYAGVNRRTGLQLRSILTIPLLVQQKVIGVLQVLDTETDHFDKTDLALLEPLAASAAIAIENARLYEQVHSERTRLRALSLRLVEVQEAERRHIARELHDEIGQTLTGLNLVLDMAARLPPDDAATNIQEAQVLVNKLLTQVRDLSLDLRPSMLDDLGLLPTLLWHFKRYTTQTNVQVSCEHTGIQGQHFAPEIETAAYRIIQEALTNVARHADTDQVTVQLWTTPETLNVQVKDCGKGFEPEIALIASESSGLTGMQERAVLLGGQLTVESDRDTGTCLTAQFPLVNPVKQERE
jgi:signal transduction histidine kinase/DNA-binding response OmpR family regulator